MFERELEELEAKDLLRGIVSRYSPQCSVITIDRKKYINFSSNDYLGLASNQETVRAVKNSLEKFAFGSGASRLVAGGSILHKKLEAHIAGFKGTEAALIFNSGYSANTGIIPSIATEPDVIFSDELNHASIIDGCRLSRAKTRIYRHRDMAHLQTLMKKSGARRKIVATDSVFSMDGDLAPLPDICEICKEHEAMLYLDDAHGTGVLGRGRGALAHFGLKPEDWIIQMGTFSKALGAYGAFVSASGDVIKWITNTARSFMFSTALPSCVIAAAEAGLSFVERNPSVVEKLWSNRDMLYKGLKGIGHYDVFSATPILTIRTDSVRGALRLSEYLYSKGIYVPAIRPPAVSVPRLRITITAAHTMEHVDTLIRILKKAETGPLN